MQLSEIQKKFIAAIYDKADDDFIKEISSGDILKEELIGIYRSNLEGNLVGALKLTFENVLKFLKEEKFSILAREFIFLNPSRSNNLDDYGENFVGFLREKKGSFIADVASLDWLKQKSYLAKNDDVGNLGDLSIIKPDELFDLRFDLSNSAFLLESDYNLLSSRYQNSKMTRKNYFLIFRSKISGIFEIEILRIPKKEYQFLKGVIDGLTLYEIYEKYEVDIQNILQKYLSNKVITKFHI